jgi:tetratricopeptide (TPR) repeat protein
LRRAGRQAEGRERVDDAMAVLRADSDRDTVAGMLELATAETFAGGPEAHQLASEALALGQALDVGPERLCDLFITRGLAAGFQNRFAEAAADLEYAARLAERAGYTFGCSRALLNVASWIVGTDPPRAAAAGRAAAEHARQLGDRYYLPTAVANQAVALLLTGEWDEAEKILRYAVEDEGLSDDTLSSAHVVTYAAILPALRGDVAAADAAAAGLVAMRSSEDPQDLAAAAVVDALRAAARNEPAEVLRHSRAAIAHAPALGVSHECMLWAWPLAARTAHELGDTTVLLELLSALDGYPVGHVPPLLRAERSLARARFRAVAGDSQTDPAFASAITELRAFGSPYHLAHALLDQAEHLAATGDSPAAGVLIDEARTIATGLGAQPLLERANAVAGAAPVHAS